MAGKPGRPKNDGKKPDPLDSIIEEKRTGKMKYFYLNGHLHLTLFIDRPGDKINTWCYPLAKRIAYTYSQTKKFRKPAFTTRQVCAMMNRGRVTVEMAIVDGKVTPPQHTYTLDERKRIHKYMWSEESVLELHEYLSSLHRGRPRKDGEIRPASDLPTARELRAIMRQEQIFYVKNKDGSFVPVWKAQDFD